jgi:PadR family transcriptional regulator, regulatory protein PadR
MDGSQLGSFLEPCLLLLLRERPDHGYNLIERLGSMGLVRGDPGRVYRVLRSLERADLVRSEWTPSHCGPARRTYHLTAKGAATLCTWVRVAEQARDALDEYIARWHRLSEPAATAVG